MITIPLPFLGLLVGMAAGPLLHWAVQWIKFALEKRRFRREERRIIGRLERYITEHRARGRQRLS